MKDQTFFEALMERLDSYSRDPQFAIMSTKALNDVQLYLEVEGDEKEKKQFDEWVQENLY